MKRILVGILVWCAYTSPLWILIVFLLYLECVPLEPSIHVGDAVHVVGGIHRGQQGIVKDGFVVSGFIRHWRYLLDTESGTYIWVHDYDLAK